MKPRPEEVAISRVDKTGEEQLDLLGLRVEQLRGRVLELGSGKTEKLKDTSGLPTDCEIISLSKHIFRGIDPYISALSEKPTWDKKTIEGGATALPFADESFDWVISVDAIPLFLTSREAVETAFKEVWRILKPGGEARFFTANESDLKMCRELFSAHGGQVRLEPLGRGVVRRYHGFVDERSRRLVIKKPPVALRR